MADFTLARAEFDRQAAILTALVATIEVSARQDGITSHEIEGEKLPVLPGGSQNTMAAAAIVLLAAHFEEYVRQQISEYAESIIIEQAYFEDEFQSKLVDVYWRSSLGRLGRFRPKDDPSWHVGAGALLSNTIRYPIGGDLGYFSAGTICEHENNMRMETILELCGRVGIKNLSDRLFKNSVLKALIGSAKKEDFSISVRAKIREYYDLRNQIVHSISQAAGIGATVFEQWVTFLVAFAAAFSQALESSLLEFSSVVEKKKAKAAAGAGAVT